MLKLVVPEREYFNESTQEFIQLKKQDLYLEHSLISLSNWESKWRIPFLGENKKTLEQTTDYFRCMSLSKDIDPIVFMTLPSDIVNQIKEYVEDPMTATWFTDNGEPPSREVLTSEVIYYMMIKLGIPMECQKWHFNRLMTLIKVCAIKESPEKKMGKQQILEKNRELNEARRSKFKTKG